MEKEDTFTLELDRKLLDYALRCGFDLTCDGEKAVRYGILAKLRVTATAWEYLHDRYMTRHAQAQYMRDLSASFDLTEADND